MTDLAGGTAATIACPNCAAEVAIADAVTNGFRCTACGADLPERPDYAVEGATTAVEIVRAYGVYGYDGEFTPAGEEAVVCPGCDMTHSLDGEVHVDGRRTTDPAAGPSDAAEVLALRCKHCGTAGVLVRPAEQEPGANVRARA